MRGLPAATVFVSLLLLLLLDLPPGGNAVRRVLVRSPEQVALAAQARLTKASALRGGDALCRDAVREGHIIRAPDRIVEPAEVCLGGKRHGGGRCREEW